jgi:hypothetical protein
MLDAVPGGVTVISVMLPTPPNRANQSRGRAGVEGFYKKKYIRNCGRELAEAKMAARRLGIRLPLAAADYTAEIQVGKKMDFDNLVARLKWAIDALVYGGIIADDGPGVFWPSSVPTQVVVRGKHPKNVLFTLMQRRTEDDQAG